MDEPAVVSMNKIKPRQVQGAILRGCPHSTVHALQELNHTMLIVYTTGVPH